MVLPHSLKTQVTILVAALSFLPNLALILTSPWIVGQPLRVNASLALWIPTLVVLCGWVGYVCADQILRPVTRLAQEAAALSTASDWEQLLAPRDPEETKILRGALAKLLRQIQVEQERREGVVATLMHDLKTPLIAFSHLLRVLREQLDLPLQERQHLLDQVLQESQRLEKRVQKMVQVHRYERGTVKLHPQPCAIHQLVADLSQRWQSLAQAQGIDLEITGSGEGIVDPEELERAIGNVLENALRYAHRQVKIQVGSHSLEISDDGPGLPAPLDELAQPYTTVPLAGNLYRGGTGGMGLFIARRILEAHGGSLSVVKSDNQGTTFRLSWGGGT
ncbi:MAG: HAMP domain-containing sensor histidine kinase [Thermostichales cyanobacterium SRBZ-1_bins_19]